MDKISISEVLERVRKGERVHRFYVENVTNRVFRHDYATTLFERKFIDSRSGDEVIQLGNKRVNVTELGRLLSCARKYDYGMAHIWIGEQVLVGEFCD